MRRAARGLLAAALVASVVGACGRTQSETGEPPPSGRYDLGRAATDSEVVAQDIDVGPDGVGLPPGSGTVSQGAAVYGAKCASCHGIRAEGMAPAYPRLVGREPRDGFPFGRDPKLEKTIGNYWSHATTLFDYVRRAMPQLAPGSLTNDEVYAVTAWLLAQNEVVKPDVRLDAEALRAVQMPAVGRFSPDDRAGRREVR